MKNLTLTLLSIFIMILNGHAAMSFLSCSQPSLSYRTDNPIRSANTELRIRQMKFFVGLTVKKYAELRGKRLNFIERFSFKISQKRMKKMLRQYEDGDGPTTLQKISWLLRGPIRTTCSYSRIYISERRRKGAN